MVAENSDSGQLIYFPLLVPSLQQTLEQRLLLALSPTGLQFCSLTFYRSQLDQNRFYYRSPLALQLARGNLARAQAIAHTLLTHILDFNSTPSPLSARVYLTPQGFLDYYFDSSSLAFWLEQLPRILIPYLNNYQLQNSLNLSEKNIFYLQYIYHRCSSLLQLGERENILSLSCSTLDPSLWIIVSPAPIPWLKSCNLWLDHPAQRQLIAQIIATIDSLAIPQPSPVIFQKVFLDLANSLENFERYCRIFGEIRAKSPLLAQTRLGLLALVQILLKKACAEVPLPYSTTIVPTMPAPRCGSQ